MMLIDENIVSVTISTQEQVKLVLRGVPAGAKAVWRELRRAPVELPLVREGDFVQAVIPGIGA